jgi:hypothetical protein
MNCSSPSWKLPLNAAAKDCWHSKPFGSLYSRPVGSIRILTYGSEYSGRRLKRHVSRNALHPQSTDSLMKSL